MDVLAVATLLSLLSVSAAKPLNCEDLVRPVDLNATRISGQWIYTEARTDGQAYSDVLNKLNSSLMDIALFTNNDTAVVKQRHMLSGKCVSGVVNLTISGNTIRNYYENGSMTITVLPACPDCLVMSFLKVEGKHIVRALKLYGKTRMLNPDDFAMYQIQAECMGLPPPSFKYDGKQDFCPEEGKDDHKA